MAHDPDPFSGFCLHCERAALYDPDAAARLDDERARRRPRWLPAVRSELLDGDGIAATTCAALLSGFDVVNRRDFLAPGFVPVTRGRPPTFFRPGWEWIDPLREAQDVQFRIAGMSAGLLAQGLLAQGQPVPDANGTVTIRMGRQEARVDLAQERQRRHPTRGRLAAQLGVPAELLRDDWRAR